ncbi:DUF4177 domain-containing protein [Tenacibaculum holothuriorum]|uniref:DUF4177 domain-containing protein n=1 Tax=Tenacibaculum holothuriorum TaxID=1635173 RepID=UPI000A3295AA|nr:DUF4177 domain-containing protein [Tenacibaculum holothuriorum]
MKEYKVESWKVSFSKNNKNLEDFLNEHARNGWKVIHIAEQSTRVVFERDKNR